MELRRFMVDLSQYKINFSGGGKEIVAGARRVGETEHNENTNDNFQF